MHESNKILSKWIIIIKKFWTISAPQAISKVIAEIKERFQPLLLHCRVRKVESVSVINFELDLVILLQKGKKHN